MNKISLNVLGIVLAVTTQFCNQISPQQKCLEDNGCKHRTEDCLTGLAIVKGLSNVGFTNEEATRATFTCNLLQSQCTLSCLEKHSF